MPERTAKRMTACVCAQAGRCERHQCHKTPHWHRLCLSREDYFRLWEEGRGPGQNGRAGSSPTRRHPSLTVLMITYNRLEYTRQALEALLAADYPHAEIVVWDNASTDGTRQWLTERLEAVPRVKLILSGENRGSVHPMNAVWGSSSATLVAKVDNDTLIPPQLFSRLAASLGESDRVGVVSGCHFRHEDLPVELAEPRSETAGPAAGLWRQPNVGGCAVMMRRETFEAFGPILTRRRGSNQPYLEGGWTDYQKRLNAARFANGYPVPLVFVEHMEDVRSPHCIQSREHETYKSVMRGMTLERTTQRFYANGAAGYFTNGRYEPFGRPETDESDEPAHVTLFVPLAGRTALWPRLAGYLDRQTYPRSRMQLILCDTSRDAAFSHTVRRWTSGCDYQDVRYLQFPVGRPGLADEPRRDADADVKASVARIYNRLRAELSTPYVWILEDDLLPPDDVCGRLLSHFDKKTVSVGAPYRSRFGDRFVVWDARGRNVVSQQRGVTNVSGNGFGCAVIRSTYFRAAQFPEDGDCDRGFYERLRQARLGAKVDWDCLSQHGEPPTEPVSVASSNDCESRQFEPIRT